MSRFHRFMIRISRSNAGATAIEYGLLAGLIALGVVASLMGTKTSLNAVFSTTSTQLGSVTSQASSTTPQPLPPSAWSGKTLTSSSRVANASSGFNYTYKYSDGSIAYLNTYPNATASNFQLSLWDPSLNQSKMASTNKNGDLTSIQILQYDSSGNVTMNSIVTNPGQNPIGLNPLSGSTMTTTYYTNNNPTSSNSTPAQSLVNFSTAAPSDLAYYKSISN